MRIRTVPPTKSTQKATFRTILTLSIISLVGCGGGGGSDSSSDKTADDITTINETTTKTGSLDLSFGVDGVVTYDGASGGPLTGDANDSIEDANGRILVAGTVKNANDDRDVAVWRYTSSGVLDTSFGSNGLVSIGNLAGGNGYDSGSAITIDSNGDILVVGSSMAPNYGDDMFLLRLRSDGTVDHTFGTDYDSDAVPDGYTVYDYWGGVDTARDVETDSNGNIFVVGSTSSFDTELAILRFASNGLLDTTFGSDGIVQEGTGSTATGGSALAFDGNGNIVVAGYRWSDERNNADVCVWRFKADGTLDSTFGEDYNLDGTADGYVWHDSAAGGEGNDYGNAMALDSQQRIVVAGESVREGISADMAVWRFTQSGSLDEAFNGGYVTHHGAAGGDSWDTADGLAVNSLGDIYVTGFGWEPTPISHMVLWKLRDDGLLDTSFMDGGIYVSPEQGTSGDDVFVDSAGRLVVSGTGVWRFVLD